MGSRNKNERWRQKWAAESVEGRTWVMEGSGAEIG